MQRCVMHDVDCIYQILFWDCVAKSRGNKCRISLNNQVSAFISPYTCAEQPQKSFAASEETECSRTKNQSKSTAWLLIKPEKSEDMQTVYQ